MTRNKSPLLSEAITAYHKSNVGMVAPRTESYHRQTLSYMLNHMGDRPLDRIQITDFETWRASLFERRLSTHTVYSYLKAVKRFYNWMDESEYWPNSTSKKIKKPKLPDLDPKAVELDDIRRVLVHLSKRERFGAEPQALICRDRAIILFLADTGCRSGGLVSLTLGALDLDCKRAIVFEKGRGGKKRRLVFFGDKTVAGIRDWLYYHPLLFGDSSPQRETPLWVSVMENRAVIGTPLKTNVIFHMLRRRAQAAGIKGRFNPHSFRHGAARQWIRNGCDLSVVSQLLGHCGIEVTAAHYARWATAELAEMHNKFGFIDNLNGGRNEAV